MRLSHLGHSAVLVEVEARRVPGDSGAREEAVRILIDPGNLSSAWQGLTDLDAIVVTHQHPDHIDPQALPVLLAANPQARLLVERSVPDLLPLPGATKLSAGDKQLIGGVTVEAVGGCHAVIHRDIPRIGNVGLVVSAPGEPRFFHPGDSLDTTPEGVDVVAVPAHGPWCAMKETIDFVRQLGAPRGFLIHEKLLAEAGWELTFSRLGEMTSTEFTDLRDGRPLTL